MGGRGVGGRIWGWVDALPRSQTRSWTNEKFRFPLARGCSWRLRLAVAVAELVLPGVACFVALMRVASGRMFRPGMPPTAPTEFQQLCPHMAHILFDLICNAQRRVSTRPSHAPASSRHVECTCSLIPIIPKPSRRGPTRRRPPSPLAACRGVRAVARYRPPPIPPPPKSAVKVAGICG